VIPLADAQALVLEACDRLPAERVGLDDALGRVLAAPVNAADPVPPFANTAMDGYAVHAADLESASPASPVQLRVVGTLPAGGVPDVTVGRGEALRIMTGAPFPKGADAVAIVETTRSEADAVWVSAPAKEGEHVRAAGEDIPAGQEVFGVGTALRPGHLGVLASVGLAEVDVVRAPVVGVLSTGDELADGTDPLRAGQIRDSNRRTLLGLLRRDGYGAVDLGIARDDEAEIERRVTDGVARCDAVLTSGGVSMGDFDYVKVVLDRLGRMQWLQVAIRPAKPFAFGVVGTTPVFGLPGNPVSSMVSYEVLARPGLRQMAGHLPDDLRYHPQTAVVDGPALRSARDRTNFVRVVAAPGPDGRLTVRQTGGQGSHQLRAMALADALAVVAPGADRAEGDVIDVLVLP
jgi:molybdopterin molybdotransferase